MIELHKVLVMGALVFTAWEGLAQAPEPVHSAPTVRAPERAEAREARLAPLGPRFGVASAQTVTLAPLSTDLLNELKRQDAAPGQKRLRIGLGRPLDQPVVVDKINAPANQWSLLPDGAHIWSVTINSPGALGMRLHLESLALPPHTRLLVYDPSDSARAMAPLTAEKLSNQREVWTQTIFGQTAILECQLPPGVGPEKVSFTLTGISHTYRTLSAVEPRAEFCENDVTCFPAWAQPAAAVARISFMDTGQEYLCGGCLINHNDTNYVADYFLTANHCVANQKVASTIQFYWFYQTANCNGVAPDMSTVPSTSGATLVATAPVPPGNDFTLLQLPQPPPNGVFYAGWTTALPTPTETVAIIHHPGLPPGDFKRISFGNETGTVNLDAFTGGGGPADSTNNAWEVQWTSGVTEDGSSGGPLFDANQLIIGQLYGGTSDCTNQSGIDLFGRFDVTYKSIRQYIDTGPVTVTINGLGSVSPNYNNQFLDFGHTYTITAKPAANYVFAGWSGTISSTSPTLTFTVQGATALQANFVPDPFVPVAGTYYGLFSDPNGVLPQSSGFITLNVTPRGGYTGRLQMGTASYSFSGSFTAEGSATQTITRRDANPLSITVAVDLSGGTDHATGTVTDGQFVAQLAADRAVFNARTNPSPYQGQYTLVIPGIAGDPTLPQGNGYGSVSVTSAGKVTLSGSLADGTSVSQSTGISKNGLWPLYVPLYRGQGLLEGWLAFDNNQPPSGFQGTLAWIKPAMSSAKLFPAGFTNQTIATTGSRFIPPVMNLTTAAFSGGDLALPFTNLFILGANDRVSNQSSNRFTLTFGRNGLFSGNVTPPGTKESVPFHGALLQNAGLGYGYFLGADQSGSLNLGP